MANAWIDHVKKWSKENNKSYGCAISDQACKDSYTKVIKKSKKELKEEKTKLINSQIRNNLLNRIKNMTDEDKPLLKMRYNLLSDPIKEDIKKIIINITRSYFNN